MRILCPAIMEWRAQALKAHKCEYCGAEDNLKMIHVRKLKDLKGKEPWEKLMIARQRKTIAVCEKCYNNIHGKK